MFQALENVLGDVVHSIFVFLILIIIPFFGQIDIKLKERFIDVYITFLLHEHSYTQLVYEKTRLFIQLDLTMIDHARVFAPSDSTYMCKVGKKAFNLLKLV